MICPKTFLEAVSTTTVHHFCLIACDWACQHVQTISSGLLRTHRTEDHSREGMICPSPCLEAVSATTVHQFCLIACDWACQHYHMLRSGFLRTHRTEDHSRESMICPSPCHEAVSTTTVHQFCLITCDWACQHYHMLRSGFLRTHRKDDHSQESMFCPSPCLEAVSTTTVHQFCLIACDWACQH